MIPHDAPPGGLNDETISIDDCGACRIRVGRNSGEARKKQVNGTGVGPGAYPITMIKAK